MHERMWKDVWKFSQQQTPAASPALSEEKNWGKEGKSAFTKIKKPKQNKSWVGLVFVSVCGCVLSYVYACEVFEDNRMEINLLSWNNKKVGLFK